MGKSKIKMEFIKIIKKSFSLFLAMSPNEKNVIYVPKAH